MRLFLLLVLAAAPVAAEPSIRWLDRTGAVKSAAIASVVSEGSLEIKVERADGKPLTIRTRHLLALIREDDTDAEQRALLMARGVAYMGGAVADARATCDRLIKAGKEAWIKEYAAAHRAMLAVRGKEPDARQRVLGFLDKYPSSRFKAWLIFARAQLYSREAEDGVEVQEILEEAFDDVLHFKGPLVVAFECLVERGRLYAFGDWRAVNSYADGLRTRFATQLAGAKPDAALSIVVESSIIRIKMEWHEQRYIVAIGLGKKPYAARDGVASLSSQSTYWLPALRSDVARLLGRLYKACGEAAEAKAAFANSLKLAPDPWRRARAAKR